MDKGGNEDYHLFAVDIDSKNQKELTPYKGVKVNILEMLKEQDHMIISVNKNNAEVLTHIKSISEWKSSSFMKTKTSLTQ